MGWISAIGDIAGGAMKDLGMDDIFNTATSAGDAAAAAGGGSWWEKGIEKAMPSIMGAAMRPKGQGYSPVAPSGHGVTANAATAMQPFQEVTKLADNNPLAGIHQWSNLFS